MHRTGMITGVIRKVFSNADINDIINDYKVHTGWKSPSETGGYEAANEKFIRDFDENLLKDLNNVQHVERKASEFNEWDL